MHHKPFFISIGMITTIMHDFLSLTIFSSISWRPTLRTFSIDSGSAKVTNPNPLKTKVITQHIYSMTQQKLTRKFYETSKVSEFDFHLSSRLLDSQMCVNYGIEIHSFESNSPFIVMVSP